MKSKGQRQREAITTDQRNRHLDEHQSEDEKQKLQVEKGGEKQQQLQEHPKDSESH